MNSVSFFGVLMALLVAVSVKGERLKRAVVGEKWPTNNISYRFDQNFTNETARATIRSVLREIETLLAVDGQKCLEFNEPNQNQEESYILFQNKENKCFGQVGYLENKTCVLNLGSNCLAPEVIMHEVLHLLGFDHEQARYDRDQHVFIHKDNIEADVEAHNFEDSEYSNYKNSQGVPYDFFSISQYPSSMFAIETAEFAIESKFPSLMNQKKIDFAKTLSPLDILQIQRFYKCRETSAPTIRGSVQIRADKQWKVGLRFFSEAAATKEFNMSVAEQYLERTFATCGHSHFWPLKYPLIDNYDDYYSRVCVEKRSLNESCQFSIECESGECHEGKCSLRSHFETIRFGNHYELLLNITSPAKCYAECLMDGPCVAASYHFSNQSCYFFKEEDFTVHRDPDYVSMELTDNALSGKVFVEFQGSRFFNPYSNFTNVASPFQCFQACLKDTRCVASSFSNSDGTICLLFGDDEYQMHKDLNYVTYIAL